MAFFRSQERARLEVSGGGYGEPAPCQCTHPVAADAHAAGGVVRASFTHHARPLREGKNHKSESLDRWTFAPKLLESPRLDNPRAFSSCAVLL